MITRIHIPDDLRKFRIGDIVETKRCFYRDAVYTSMVGHVIGVSLNVQDEPEVILTVRWACGGETGIHPSCVTDILDPIK